MLILTLCIAAISHGKYRQDISAIVSAAYRQAYMIYRITKEHIPFVIACLEPVMVVKTVKVAKVA